MSVFNSNIFFSSKTYFKPNKWNRTESERRNKKWRQYISNSVCINCCHMWVIKWAHDAFFSLSTVRPRISIWTVRSYFESRCVYAYNLCEYWIVFEIFLFIFAFTMVHKHTHGTHTQPEQIWYVKVIGMLTVFFLHSFFCCFLFLRRRSNW